MGLAPGTELSAVVMAGGRVGWARAPGPDQVWHSRTHSRASEGAPLDDDLPVSKAGFKFLALRVLTNYYSEEKADNCIRK